MATCLPLTYICHCWLFLCGIRFRIRFSVRVSVSVNVSDRVKVRLKVLLTRLTLGVLHAFVRVWLASSHLRFPNFQKCRKGITGNIIVFCICDRGLKHAVSELLPNNYYQLFQLIPHPYTIYGIVA